MRTPTTSIRPGMLATISAVCLSAVLGGAPAAPAAAAPAPAPRAAATFANPYERGPAPTSAGIEAARGPFAIGQVSVPDTETPGFGAATIYYPTDTSRGTFGGVAIVPGYTNTQYAVSWYGPQLASQGFVVITFDTQDRYDFPAARGDQLLAALGYLTTRSSVRGQVDPARVAVMGYSMGGGGVLEAAKNRTDLRAAISLTGYNSDKTWPEVRTPTLLVGAQNDVVAPVSSHSLRFYDTLTSVSDKAYVELAGASHAAPMSQNTTIARFSVSWLKRYVDDDVRYEQFLCPGPVIAGPVSAARNTCPGS